MITQFIHSLRLFIAYSSDCTPQSIIGYVLGILLCIGSVISYIPQGYIIVKTKSIEGINEFTIILLNIGNFCLALNSVIINWYKWKCFDKCGWWYCMAQLLPFYQILMGWIVVFIFYMIYINYKIKNTEKRIFNAIVYGLMYIGFVFVVLSISIGENEGSTGPAKSEFFNIFAQFLGYLSATCNAIMWLPQIYTILKNKDYGNLSIIMFVMQVPGNIIIILFQALIFQQPVSTWITYVISAVEQSIIVFLIIFYYLKNRTTLQTTQNTIVEQELQ